MIKEIGLLDEALRIRELLMRPAHKTPAEALVVFLKYMTEKHGVRSFSEPQWSSWRAFYAKSPIMTSLFEYMGL